MDNSGIFAMLQDIVVIGVLCSVACSQYQPVFCLFILCKLHVPFTKLEGPVIYRVRFDCGVSCTLSCAVIQSH